MRWHVEQTGSFIATDGRGNPHWLLVFTEYIDVPATSKGGAKKKEVPTSIKTPEGKHVDRLGRGEYKVVEMGLRAHVRRPGRILKAGPVHHPERHRTGEHGGKSGPSAAESRRGVTSRCHTGEVR